MIRKIDRSDYPRLMEIWESAVVHTHDFLQREDFLYYKGCIPAYFPHVTLVGFEQAKLLVAFVGIFNGSIEMLFVDNHYRGRGIGKELVVYAMNHFGITKVDVNEQNIQAVGFYKHIGFEVYERSSLDNEGKPYPILHMQL